MLQLQEHALDLRSSDVAARRAIAQHDPVTRDDQREWIGSACRSDRPCRTGPAHQGGELTVADGAAVAHIGEVLEHGAAEPVCEPQVDGQLEAAAEAGEVVVELPHGIIQAAGGQQDPRADLAGEPGQDRVVVLARVRHPDQTDRRRRKQQLGIPDISAGGP